MLNLHSQSAMLKKRKAFKVFWASSGFVLLCWSSLGEPRLSSFSTAYEDSAAPLHMERAMTAGFPFMTLHLLQSHYPSCAHPCFQVKCGGCLYLLVSCFSRPSWVPSWFWDRWCSWEWAMFKGTVIEWTGSTVTTGSSEFEVKTGQKSDSSSSTSSSFSAPSHSEAGPKWVCSSVCQSWLLALSPSEPGLKPRHHTPGIRMVMAACTARRMMLSMANIQWGLMWWFRRTLLTWQIITDFKRLLHFWKGFKFPQEINHI